MLPTVMLQQGWSEGQKSGNQVNYRRRLADKSERKGEKVGIISRLCVFLIIWVNAAGPLQQPGPDRATCFVGSVVTLLTRPVLTQTSLSSATNTRFPQFFLGGAVSCSCFTRIRAHLQIPQLQLCFLFMSVQLMVQKRCRKAGRLLVLYLIKELKECLSNASMQAGCLKAQLLFSSHIRGPKNQPSTVSRWPLCRIGVHVGSSSQWDKCWPLALDLTPLFQGLGAGTDVGKLPHVNKSEREALLLKDSVFSVTLLCI